MSRIANFIVISFALLSDGENVMSCKVLGMNSACADYACIYCKIMKNARWDTSKPENYYWMDGNGRTLAENRDLAKKSSNNYGCIRFASTGHSN
ncbi:hypothetical protein OS493_038390 [Desmophyllum pertusum]|uniref:Ig-like domain-containing protein n=1 Tax=Desmophyllum pertusum TaxID=174260 RepID=A0A9W9Z6J8_9CNID|nr:hypothetical protein OS493_038390 [Desmophyllum pertusum]